MCDGNLKSRGTALLMEMGYGKGLVGNEIHRFQYDDKCRVFVGQIAAAPGNVLMSLDFSQIELRVGSFYCRNPKMLDTYRSGGDIHAQTTYVIFNVPFEVAVDKNAPNYKEHRTIAKNCNFGVFYGLFPQGLQETLRFKAGLDTPLDRCRAIIDNMKAGYSGLTTCQKKTKKTAQDTCYAETWLGRRRYLIGMLSEDWGKHSFAERCALNTAYPGNSRGHFESRLRSNH